MPVRESDAARAPPAARAYAPRDPEESVVARVVRDHLDQLRERIAAADSESEDPHPGGDPARLPAFVLRELRAIADCGDFTKGFVRLRCGTCRADRIVPFSCKGRLCPSCAGRRMAETAAWLVDRILRRDVGWRQWVFTFPAPLAVGLCFRADLAAAVTRVCVRVLADLQRARAPAGAGLPLPTAIVFVQRFSDGLAPWLHLHVLAPDGVFRHDPRSCAVVFEPQPPPTPDEVAWSCRRIAARVTALLRRRTATRLDHPLLARCAEQPAHQVRAPAPPPGRARPANPLRSEHDGFTVHAATAVPPNRPAELERLCRYLLRPAVPAERLRMLPDGRVSLALKRPRGAVRELRFEPVAFLARLAALVPPPMFNMVRWFGPLSSASPRRAAVLPDPPASTPDRPTAPPRPGRMSHADLLRRVFLIDLLACPCGGRLRQIAVITDPDIVQAILAAVILSHQAPARAPPERPHRSGP